MKKKTLLSIVGIGISGVLLGGIVFSVLSSKTMKVVVPTKTIQAGQTFSSSNLKLKDVPKKAVVGNITYTKIEDVAGKTAVSDICSEEMITTSRVANSKESGYIANMNDKQDFALQVNLDSSYQITGVEIGDYVTIAASIQDDENNNITTGKIGGSNYKVVGVEKNEDGYIVNLTIEVSANDLTTVSHVVLNNAYVIAFVSGKQKAVTVPGISQKDLANQLQNNK